MGASQANGWRASNVTIQGDIVVPKKLVKRKRPCMRSCRLESLVKASKIISEWNNFQILNPNFFPWIQEMCNKILFLTKTLSKERPKRDIFPCLYISSCRNQLLINMAALNFKQAKNIKTEAWKESIPLQSFINTTPKIWSAASLTSIGFPNSFPGPITAACQNSQKTAIKMSHYSEPWWNPWHNQRNRIQILITSCRIP